VHFVYLDETGDETCVGFSAICLPAVNYKQSFSLVKEFRRRLRNSDGINTTTELHASKFTSHRGKLGQSGHSVRQERRCQIFNEKLSLIAHLPGVSILNAFSHTPPKQATYHANPEGYRSTEESRNSHI